MPFAELYCRSADGSNLNAGSTNTAAASLTYASGSWVQATRIFTVASGDPVADGVAVGDLVSVYADGSSVTGFCGYVTARTTTTITIHATRSSGTSPTDGTGNRTLKVGGAWKGPNAASMFPYNFVAGVMTNDAGHTPRVSLIGTFNITAAMNHAVGGPVSFRGATATAGDGGKAIIDGGTSGASYVLLTVTGALISLADIIFQNNGATGGAAGVFYNTGGSRAMLRRLVFAGMRGSGVSLSENQLCVIESIAHNNNLSNGTNNAGFNITGANRMIRCVARDNPGSNTAGFILGNGALLHKCIVKGNGGIGVSMIGSTGHANVMIGTEVYNNVSDGLRITPPSGQMPTYIEDCNFVGNGGWGINGTGAIGRSGMIINCGFGSGTQENTLGMTTGLLSIEEIDSVVYPADTTPWSDPDNDDFEIVLSAAKGAGRGEFPHQFPTTGFPDRGAAQHRQIKFKTIGSPIIS